MANEFLSINLPGNVDLLIICGTCIVRRTSVILLHAMYTFISSGMANVNTFSMEI